jgi:hypothetical protein
MSGDRFTSNRESLGSARIRRELNPTSLTCGSTLGDRHRSASLQVRKSMLCPRGDLHTIHTPRAAVTAAQCCCRRRAQRRRPGIESSGSRPPRQGIADSLGECPSVRLRRFRRGRRPPCRRPVHMVTTAYRARRRRPSRRAYPTSNPSWPDEPRVRPCEVAIGLGSHDLGVATYAAQLYRAGLFPIVVCTGATSSMTRERFPRGEAVHYRTPSSWAFPNTAILVEPRATSSGCRYGRPPWTTVRPIRSSPSPRPRFPGPRLCNLAAGM